MLFKYFITFDDGGDIKSFHKSKQDCADDCNEYIVKLIPIDRDIVSEDLNKSVDKFVNNINDQTRKLNIEFKKVIKNLKGIVR